MSIRNLDGFFRPRSVAVIGASARPGSVGERVFRNLLSGGFQGEIAAINPRHDEILGQPALSRLDQMGSAPDLAVVATPPQALIEVLEALGEQGCRAAMVVTVTRNDEFLVDPEALLAMAGRYQMRLLGPGCAGLTIPSIGLNASMAVERLAEGALAFVSESSGLAMAVQHWALERSIGFSSFFSLGEGLDVDLPDLVDYLAIDSRTRAILVAQSDIKRGRKTLSALRAAARTKPVVVLKFDQQLDPDPLAATEASAEILANRVRWKRQAFDAAVRRSGAVRVSGFDDLFSTAELLSHTQSIGGPRLAVISNSAGAGLLTRDALARADGLWPDFGADLDGALAERFPAALCHRGLINLGRWASADELIIAIEQLTSSGQVDAIVLTLTPNLVSDLDSLAHAVIDGVGKPSIPVLGCLLGGDGARAAAQRFAAADWPSFLSPEELVSAVARLEDYRCNQQALTELPEFDPDERVLDQQQIRAIVVRGQSRELRRFDEVRSKQLLAAAGIDGLPTRIVETPDQAAEAAAAIGYPVALKAVLQEPVNALDQRLYRLDLSDEDAVLHAAERLARQVRLRGFEQIAAYAVQAMVSRPTAISLSLGMHVDPVFGPLLYVGQGGPATMAIGDRALGLPPLNHSLARDMIRRTRVARQLDGFEVPRETLEHRLAEMLVRLSDLVQAEPAIASIRVNPWLLDGQGQLALDAQVELLSPGETRRISAIAPYPSRERERMDFHGDVIELRPIRPEDARAHADFFNQLEPDDQRFRFFGVVRHPERSQLARFTQIDYDREMAFVAKTTDETRDTLGVVRAVLDQARATAEFAIVVRSDLKGGGLGRRLLEKMIDYCGRQGVQVLTGQVLEDNDRMLRLARALGFRINPASQGVHEIALTLQAE